MRKDDRQEDDGIKFFKGALVLIPTGLLCWYLLYKLAVWMHSVYCW